MDESNFTRKTWPPNVWLGVSVENDEYISRIAHLQRTPAHLRFLSIEPLLGPLKLNKTLLRGIQWVIVGGESGPKANRMEAEWVLEIKQQCEKFGVAFFFKQWGAHDETGKRVGKRLLVEFYKDELGMASPKPSGHYFCCPLAFDVDSSMLSDDVRFCRSGATERIM